SLNLALCPEGRASAPAPLALRHRPDPEGGPRTALLVPSAQRFIESDRARQLSKANPCVLSNFRPALPRIVNAIVNPASELCLVTNDPIEVVALPHGTGSTPFSGALECVCRERFPLVDLRRFLRRSEQVSCDPLSNRTCGFPAYGLPMIFS